MKKLFLFILSIGLLLGMSAVSYADTKIGVLDVQKVLQNIPQVPALQAQLKKQFAPQEEKITAAQKQFKADLDKYNRDRAVMKDSERKALQKKIIAEQDKLRGLQASFQQQLIAAQRKGMQSILKDIENTVNDVAKDQQLNLVLTKAAIVYSDPDMDITDQVVKKLK